AKHHPAALPQPQPETPLNLDLGTLDAPLSSDYHLPAIGTDPCPPAAIGAAAAQVATGNVQGTAQAGTYKWIGSYTNTPAGSAGATLRSGFEQRYIESV